MKAFEPRLGTKEIKFLLRNQQTRHPGKSLSTVSKHKTMDMVEMSMGEHHGADSFGLDASFDQRLGKATHGRMPSIRRTSIDQGYRASIVNCECIDGKPELSVE